MLRTLSEAGTGATTVRRIHAVLRSALADAVRSGLVRTNAASTAIVVKRSRPKVNPWSAEELGMFLDHAAADEWGPIFG